MKKDKALLPRLYVYQSENCEILAQFLKFRGFEVQCTNESNALPLLGNGYDAYIMDYVKTKNGPNLSLLQELRRNKASKNAPVLMLSAFCVSKFAIQAYEAGADDYIARPCNYEVLICKIKALLKRCEYSPEVVKNEYIIGSYVLDTQSCTLTNKFECVEITPREAKILAILAKYKNELVPISTFMRIFWDGSYDFWSKRSLDVYMCYLRKRLRMEPSVCIITIPKQGYKLVTAAE